MQFFKHNINTLLKVNLPYRPQQAGACRKPSWLPVAKSKIYRIPKRPVISDEEKAELKRVHFQYKTKMRAIKKFCRDELVRERATLESATSELSLRLEAEDWEKCLKLNNEWNSQIAKERELRWCEEAKEREKRALEIIERTDRERELALKKASEEIRRQKELCSTFITEENLDEAIECALANPVDYNYAIDLQENKYLGRDTPINKQDNKSNSVSV